MYLFRLRVDRTGLTIWWALRTSQRRGPTGKLDGEEGEKGGRSIPSPTDQGSIMMDHVKFLMHLILNGMLQHRWGIDGWVPIAKYWDPGPQDD